MMILWIFNKSPRAKAYSMNIFLLKTIFIILTLFLSLPLASEEIIVPKLDLNYWNHKKIKNNNNCYNYSTNRRTDNFAQPGWASGIRLKKSNLNCLDITNAAKKDLGLSTTSYFPYQNKNENTLLALVVAPGIDYHWFRRDSNQLWSHKIGNAPASDEDDEGYLIRNPEKAERGIYTEFCGYFKIKNYDLNSHEQNSGYVQIGNMKSLPKKSLPTPSPAPSIFSNPAINQPPVLSNSKLTLLKYSGRRNPEVNLNEWEANLSQIGKAFFLQLVKDVNKVQNSPNLFHINKNQKNNLGYRGVLFEDELGIYFPPHWSIKLFNSYIYIENNTQRTTYVFKSEPAGQLEQIILNQNVFFD